MTAPYTPQKQAVDPTEMRPEDWQGYLAKARQALQADPHDHEALQAIRDANQALGVYDEAEAASPGERIQAGVSGGLRGLGEAALDIPRGMVSLFTHPIETVKNIPNIPGALASAVTSDDPETVARGVGNIGSLLAPFAKAGPGGSFRLGTPPGASVGSAVTSGIGRALGRVAQVPRSVGAMLDRPMLANELARLKIADLTRRAVAPEAPPSAPPGVVGHIDAGPVEDIGQALADFKAGKISQEDLDTALGYAVRPNVGESPLTPSPPRAPGPSVGPPSMRTVTPDPLAEPTFQRRDLASLGRGEQFPYYPRGGAEEQAMPPGPASPSGPPGHVPPLAPGQLKTLLDLSPQQFEAASGMLSPEMRAQIQELRAAGATGAHVEATVGRLGAPSFEGGGFQGISEAMAHPTYQQAGTLAARILKDPKLLAQYPQFAGQAPEAATATLQRMLVEHARGGGQMPALTSLPRFLARLSSP